MYSHTQRALYPTTTAIELAGRNQLRCGLFIQNVDDTEIVLIYGASYKDHPYSGGLRLYPHTWILLEPQDNAAGQWYIKALQGTVGTVTVTVIEFFGKPPVPTRWW